MWYIGWDCTLHRYTVYEDSIEGTPEFMRRVASFELKIEAESMLRNLTYEIEFQLKSVHKCPHFDCSHYDYWE